MRMAGAIVILTALAGCAGAQISDVASAKATGPAPARILVDVSAAQAGGETQTNAANKVASELRADLLQRLAKAGVKAEPFVSDTHHPGAAVLRVSVVEADPGSLLERFVIGFGAGRAQLAVKADFESTDSADAYAMTAFDTSSDSGYKPGIILPAGIALATRNIIHLAIGGGIDAAVNVNGGLDGPVNRTASAIVGQLKTYYVSVGWHWPVEDVAMAE